MKIYTKGGDTGETSLFDKTRVSKADGRVDAYGEVDELNAALGVARAFLPPEGGSHVPGDGPHDGGGFRLQAEDLAQAIEAIQKDLFGIGAMLADPAAKIAARVTKAHVGDAEVARLEALIDRLEEELPPLRRFILPGGGRAGAALHLARTVCRRAERRAVALGADAHAGVIVYLNRLSDLLFVMARAVNHREGVPETEW
ncbi:MAG: cob(I)yrinic acid a,c-diamide adenosyltransferase [Vicinamibacterales bacterium]